MSENNESKLSQYIFGKIKMELDNADKFGHMREKKGIAKELLHSDFRRWKMLCWEQNFDDGICRLTEYAAKLFGVPEQCENFPFCLFGRGILSQQTEAAFRRADFRLRAGEEHFSFEAVVNSSPDMPQWLEIECCMETNLEGIPAYAIGIAHDISSKKLLEQKYQDQIAYRNGLCANTLNCMRIDLTEDRITEYNTPIGEITEMCALFPTADACLRKITEDMVRKADIEQYQEILTTEGLRRAYNNGENSVVVEYYDNLFHKWLQIKFVILKNPSNSHIECFGICNDISETKLLEIALNSVTKQDYKSVGIIDTQANEYLYITDRDADKIMVNSYEDIEEVFSFIIDEWKKLLEDIELRLIKEQVLANLEEKKEYSLIFVGKEDRRRYQVYFFYVENDEQLIMAVVRDITDDALLKQLKYNAEHDALTELYNRERTFEMCGRMMAEYPEETFAVLHFDIRKFRLYNSFFGGAEGDLLLKYIADLLRELSTSYPYCVFGRIEADVFFLCIPWKEGAAEESHRWLQARLAEYRNDYQVTVSCGVYLAQNRLLTAEAMFDRASIAVKDRRDGQQDAVDYFGENEELQLRQEHEIALDMYRALEEKQFAVYLQPKYKLFSGEPFGAEALVRWIHPEKGMIRPDEFIPLFESNGFIIQLDQYMWEQVCVLLKRWKNEGKNPDPISVNMSRVSMYSPQTVSFLKNLIKKYELSPALLNLELTESAYMDAPEEMKARLMELRAAGFQIMMDDFGSGYSSLNTLREVPVDYLKVDRVFLASVDSDERSRVVLASVVHMASRMGIPVITEGVETEAQRDFLAGIGCDYIQGFLFARPMPVEQYEKLVFQKKSHDLEQKEGHSLNTAVFANLKAEMYQITNLLPYEIALAEYVGDSFSYLSANAAFQKTFGLHRDVMNRAELIEKHLSEADYERLNALYRTVAGNEKSGTCRLNWRHTDGHHSEYLVQVQYVGKSEYSRVMTSTFTELSQNVRMGE